MPTDDKVILNNILHWLSKATCQGAAEAQALLTAVAYVQGAIKALEAPKPPEDNV